MEDDLVARCQAWLDLEAEAEQLAGRWSDLETLAVRQFGWLNLSPAARQAVPMAAEMGQIQARLESIEQALETSLQDLRAEPAKDVAGAIAKVIVAARPFLHEPDDEHQFLVDAVARLAALAQLDERR